jgi:hypothetical protein
MPYIKPEAVDSPRAKWSLMKVLVPGKPGHIAVALGKWEDDPVIALRWNGSDDSPVGNPQSRGLPTWFILESPYAEAVIGALPSEQQALVRNFIAS